MALFSKDIDTYFQIVYIGNNFYFLRLITNCVVYLQEG